MSLARKPPGTLGEDGGGIGVAFHLDCIAARIREDHLAPFLRRAGVLSSWFVDERDTRRSKPLHPERLVLIGVSQRERVLFTVFAELAADGVRIISARKATKAL